MSKYLRKLEIWRRKLDGGVPVYIIPTYRCNFKCSYCANKLNRGYIPEAKISIVQRWTEALANFPVTISEIHITGGEPLLYPFIDQLIVAILDLGIPVNMDTNISLVRRLVRTELHKERWLLQITATMHTEFWNNYIDYEDAVEGWRKRGFRVIKQSLGVDDTVQKYHDLIIRPTYTETNNPSWRSKRFIFTPDVKLWISDRHIGDHYLPKEDK